jgi:hypothetical protein
MKYDEICKCGSIMNHDPSIFICKCHVQSSTLQTLRGTREKCFLQGVGPAEIEGYGMERRAAKLMAGGSSFRSQHGKRMEAI